MEKLLLVDGHNLLFRMYFGMPFPFQNQKGEDITATVGFVGTVVKMIKYLEATDCLVVFDGENSLQARSQEKLYKANRIDDRFDETNNPFSQLRYIKAVLDFLKISWIETDGFECDDYISIVAKRNNGETYISSTDKDFYQLIDDKIKVFKFNGKKSQVLDENYVVNKYNVLPSEFCLYKAIVGDKSDNIAGITKVGLKTALKIIKSIGNSTNDAYFDIFKQNQSLIQKNIELIKQPNHKFECLVENKDYPIDYEKIKNFKSLRDINEITVNL